MGIGRALASALAREGVNLVLNARSEAPLREAYKECIALGVSVDFVAGNAAEPETIDQMTAKAASMGGLFGFIHAAGLLYPGAFLWELPVRDFQAIFHVNVDAAHQLIRACIPRLLPQGSGLAVFFGSGAAEKTQPGIAAYCAAKAAEEHLARQLAAEAPQITTFVYRPGIVETRMQVQARQCRGGAADLVRKTFEPWKENGMLLTPEASAAGLISILSSDWKHLHGKTWDVRAL